MKKFLTFGIILLFIGLSIPSTGRVEEQSSTKILNGNTLYVGGSGPGNYTQIQDAIDDANDGDTVFVFSGVYGADITVDKSISLIGENQETTVVEGGNDGILISADGVRVMNFTIQKCGGFWHRSGIYVGSNHNTISHVSIANNGVLNGIFLEESYNSTISDNIITNNLYIGIRLEYSSNNIITGNLVSNVAANGVSLAESVDNKIYSNIVAKCSWGGINLGSSSENNIVYHNDFFNNNFDNAYDEENNIWDNGYPSGGNYWDDYNGTDADGDGIGDTPYNITGGSNQDRYPLMEPYGQTELEIGHISKGIFKINAEIKNIGDYNALQVNWSITLDGGSILLGKETSGQIPYILAGKSETVSSNLIIAFGRCQITITAEALNAPKVTKTIGGFIILFFIII